MSVTSDLETVTLRDATWRDIATLARLDAQLFAHDAWSEATWWAEFAERPRRRYVVAAAAAQGHGDEGSGPAVTDGGVDEDAPEMRAGRTVEGRTGGDHAHSEDDHGDHTTILGYAGLDVAGSAADVMTIATTHAARGAGIGKLLLTRLVDLAATEGAEALLLEVRADNAPALGLYERHGFERINVRRRYYQPGDVDAVIMRKLLETR